MTGPIDPALFGMPDATTAGVQAGVTLTNYTGPMTITTPGTVIENVIINGTLTVVADNVTIRNCVIQNFTWWGVFSDNADNTRVEYCDIDGTGSSRTSGLGVGGGTNSAIIGCDISGMVIGIQLFGRCEVRDNYIHDLFETSSDPDARHFDGITLFGGQDGSVIEHNTISMPENGGGTAAVFIKTEFGAINDIMVRNNLMYGDPSYTIYVEEAFGRQITNVTLDSNYVEHGIWGYYLIVGNNPVITNNVTWNNDTDPTPYPGPPVDRFPDAVNDSVSTAFNTAVTFNALANDTLGDTPTVVSDFDAVTGNGGTVSYQNGAFTYAPAVDWSGTDTFDYTILDTDGDVDSAIVSVTVAATPPPPPPPPPGVTLIGTSGSDTLQGGAGNDIIDGRGGWDWLYGNAGNDRIIGGTGNDDLFGGTGADVFDYNSTSESPRNGGQRDFIHDFEVGVDKIDLSTIDAKTNVSGNQAFTFQGQGTFGFSSSAQPGLLRYHHEVDGDGNWNTIVEATTNTSRGVDLQISLLGQHVLTANDFVL